MPTPEELARINIDKELTACGWTIQDMSGLNRYASLGVGDTLENICSIFVDSAHRTPEYGERGVPAIGPRDVVNGKLDLENARLVNEEEFKIQTRRHVPSTGDIVYSRELSFGWGANIPENVQLCLSQGMCLFRTNDEVDNRYLVMALNGPLGRKQAEDAATGSTHPHINLGEIRAYRFPIPLLEEQRRIAAGVEQRLSVARQVESSIEEALVPASRLRQAVLKSAFEGRLT